MDYWQLGVLLYELLFFALPFTGKNPNATRERILSSPMHKANGRITKTCKELFGRLLQKDSRRRIGSAEEIMKHDVFKGIDWEKLEKKKDTPPVDLTTGTKGV